MITRGTYCKPFSSATCELLGSFLVASALDEDVQHVALLIYCPPQVMNAPVNRGEDFIEVPPVTGAGTATAQVVGVSLTELQAPSADRLVSESDAAHAHHFFDVAVTQ